MSSPSSACRSAPTTQMSPAPTRLFQARAKIGHLLIPTTATATATLDKRRARHLGTRRAVHRKPACADHADGVFDVGRQVLDRHQERADVPRTPYQSAGIRRMPRPAPSIARSSPNGPDKLSACVHSTSRDSTCSVTTGSGAAGGCGAQCRLESSVVLATEVIVCPQEA